MQRGYFLACPSVLYMRGHPLNNSVRNINFLPDPVTENSAVSLHGRRRQQDKDVLLQPFETETVVLVC